MGIVIRVNTLEDMCRLMCDNIIPTNSQYEDEYERCWQTGEYDDQYCADCPHNSDCNGEDEE